VVCETGERMGRTQVAIAQAARSTHAHTASSELITACSTSITGPAANTRSCSLWWCDMFACAESRPPGQCDRVTLRHVAPGLGATRFTTSTSSTKQCVAWEPRGSTHQPPLLNSVWLGSHAVHHINLLY
jgi:hypothetical protein